MIFGAKELALNLPCGRMDYIVFGRGEKPLIMVQGLNTRGVKGAADSLAWMYRIFARDYKVYLFDRRAELPPRVTVRELAADLAAAMDALGLAKAHVFGVSQGGMIAQYLAIDRPDLVEKMVLAVTLSRNNDRVEQVIKNWAELTERHDWKALVADMAERMYSPAFLKKYRPLLPVLTFLQKPRDVERFLTLARACLTCTAYDELDQITCPVLVLGGGEDQVVGGQASTEIAEKLGCGIHLYEGLGHAAYEEAKDFNRRVYDFFRS